LLDEVEEILDEYDEQVPLTSRQIFYVLVGRYGCEKTEAASGRLGNLLVAARRAERIAWRAIRDDSLTVARPRPRYGDADSFVTRVARQIDDFELDPTLGQRIALEVWCEASGMVPQLQRVADPYGVEVYSGSGFESLTARFETMERVYDNLAANTRPKRTVVLRVGDLDPSGRSAVDSFAADVWELLAEYPVADGHADLSSVLSVEHVAVTAAQIAEHELPTQPQKSEDKRGEHMNESVQAEALPPDVLAVVVDDAIRQHIIPSRLAALQARSAAERDRLRERLGFENTEEEEN
jgi:hypothetical protein